MTHRRTGHRVFFFFAHCRRYYNLKSEISDISKWDYTEILWHFNSRRLRNLTNIFKISIRGYGNPMIFWFEEATEIRRIFSLEVMEILWHFDSRRLRKSDKYFHWRLWKILWHFDSRRLRKSDEYFHWRLWKSYDISIGGYGNPMIFRLEAMEIRCKFWKPFGKSKPLYKSKYGKSVSSTGG